MRIQSPRCRAPVIRWTNLIASRIGVLCVLLLGSPGATQAEDVGYPTFLSPHADPIAVSGDRVFVVNTPADSVDVIDRPTRMVVARISVGIDPVSIAIRPDGAEAWVSNHVSDSVSVIDLNPESATHLQVVATVQDFHPVTKATRFDEPVGIAFASNDKAYVALSSENQVAIVDVGTREIQGHLSITAQDPRAIAVRGNRLYVLPFESNNQTQISGCVGTLGTDLCTFDAQQHVINNNNVLSTFAVVDIVKHPQIPDRDLYVFDIATDQLVEVVNTLGTLLYGLAVDSAGRVFVTQTDARNDINGRAGTEGDGLAEMQNRAFLNQITRVDCGGASCASPQFIDLEPRPPANPAPGTALATPFAIQISEDDTTLVASAAGSNQLFTVDAASGSVLGRVDVGAVPRGIALISDASGRPDQAWVLNAVANTVQRVDVTLPADPQVTDTIALEDPTHPAVKRGRVAFNDANASTTGTFSCESCHPDGGTDQLLWILDTPICDIPGCTQIPPRITMPIRGLRDTAPYHWDGIPGDPYGGINTGSLTASVAPNCSLDEPESCTRNLVDGGLASTMCDEATCPANEEGKDGALTAAERDDMATFLLSVPYPPAQRRSYDNVLSSTAVNGFRLFHIDGDLQPQVNVCGDCHRMPFWVSTNTPGTGMEAPTWRGAYDRWLILPQGRLNIIDFSFYRSITTVGVPERNMWRFSWGSRPRFDPVWNMVTEGSTGFSGSFARQVTLNTESANTTLTRDLLDALERSASEDAIVLTGTGVFLDQGSANAVSLAFERGLYRIMDNGETFTRADLVSRAADGGLVATLTGRLGDQVDVDHPQPALWTFGTMHLQRGRQQFPTLTAGNPILRLSGRHVQVGAHVLVDGRRVSANVRCLNGTLPDCASETLEIHLAQLPDQSGIHFLQVQNRDGLFSNDFIFFTSAPGTQASFDVSGPWFNAAQGGHGWFVEHLPPIAPGAPDRLNVYWYVYADGQPVWLLGQGEFVDGRAELETFITAGGGFPPDFDPADVQLIPWGSMHFEFADNVTGNVSWEPILAGYQAGSLNVQQIAPVAQTPAACQSGSYFNPDQAGHGFVAQVVEVNGNTEVVLSWYVYLDGAQVWLQGQAALVDGRADVPMTLFSGAGFPPDFASTDVTSIAWGTVTLQFTGPDAARVDWVSEVSGYGSGGTDLVRLTSLTGRSCAGQ